MYKSLQVLRTLVAVTAADGSVIPLDTRVVVVNFKENGDASTITARVQDPELPGLNRLRVTLLPSQVATTKRGRPTTETE